MNNFIDLLKNVIVILYIIGISYLILINESIAEAYNIPYYIIPIMFFVSIVFFAYEYIRIYTNSKKLEHEFTSIVNHTFRTPLTRIMWFTKELEKEITMNEKLLLSQNISNSTKKILDIVDLFVGIKDINDQSGYFFKAESIRDIIENIISKYKEEINKKNIKFDIPTFKEIPLITIDLKKISFVFDTIIENAIFYTPKGGQVIVKAEFYRHKLIIEVIDTGIGFSFFEKRKVFNKFYRSKRAILVYPDGMGLKLYLSKQIIKRHKGKIYVFSKGKNKGSTFFVELPLS